MKKIFSLLIFLIPSIAYSQRIQTAEDSLLTGTSKNKLSLGGYGEAHITYNVNEEEAEANLDRIVLFVGYRFNNRISFHSELEVEDAKIAGGEPGGEVAMEQAYLKFDIGRVNHLDAGLIIPRIGIINENHLPTTFNGVNRPFVERYVIPTTWREIGISWYGTIERLGGLQYSLAVVNGLNAAGFDAMTGIRGGRYEGRDAVFTNMGTTASLAYSFKGLRLQSSVYYGGTVPKTIVNIDTTLLDQNFTLKGGAFSSPVTLLEANVQYDWKALRLRALGSYLHFTNPYKLDIAYDILIAEKTIGWYGEAAVDVLYGAYHDEKKLLLFGRYERIDNTSNSFFYTGYSGQSFIIGGITFQPTNGVAIKLDYVKHYISGREEGLVNLGIGYSF